MHRLSIGNHRAPVVTGTLVSWHTHACLVQQGVCGAGAAVHRHKGHTAGDIRLTQATAGGLAGAEVFLVDHRLGAGGGGLRWGAGRETLRPRGPGPTGGAVGASRQARGTYCRHHLASHGAARPWWRRHARRRTAQHTGSPRSSRSCRCRTCSSGGGRNVRSQPHIMCPCAPLVPSQALQPQGTCTGIWEPGFMGPASP